jgi:anti-sigma factor RsiW
MRCEKVRLKIDAYVTGELSPGARAAVEEHLKTCDGCRLAAAAARKFIDLGQASSIPPVPEGFARRLAVLARQKAGRRAPAAASWNLVAWWRTVSMPMQAAAAAVLVIGLATGLLIGWNTWQAPAAPPAQAASQTDPLASYNVDYLTDAPDGSLAQTYLALVSSAQEGK